MAPQQYPPKAWLPQNISLYVQDAFATFPNEFYGVYDVVHVALFVLIVPNNDPRDLLNNLVKLLSSFYPNFKALDLACLCDEVLLTRWFRARRLPAVERS